MAAALAARGVKKGDRVLVQSKNCNQMFESMFACFRLGAVWVPTNFRQTPGEVAYLAQSSGASAMICHSDFPEHVTAAREAAPDIRLVISIGASEFGEDYDALVAQYDGVGVPTDGRRARRSMLVLLHVGHDGPSQGRGADARPDGLRDHEPPLRPDAGHHASGRLPRPGAALAWCRHPPARAGGARGQDRAAPERPVRCRRGLGAGRALADHQHVHGAHHREDADRASIGRRARPLVPALRDLCGCAHVPGGPEARAEESSERSWSNTSGWARSPATSPCFRPRSTRPRMARA